MKKRVIWITATSLALAVAGQVVADQLFPANTIDFLISESAAAHSSPSRENATDSLFEARKSSVDRASRRIAAEDSPHPYYFRRHR